MLQVKNILQTTKEALEAGSITLQEAARILCKAGFTNFTDIKATVRLLDINSLSLSMMAEATTATAEKENICTDIQVIEPEEPDEITGTDEGREATASAEKQAEINKNKSFKELKKGDYIRLIQGLGKDNSIKDFLSTFTGDYSPNFPLCKIDRIESLSDEELNNYDFMNRKPENFEGGEISFVYDLFKNRFHLTKEMIKTAVTSVCMLRTPSRCLFIDPEGYSYSRYILALPASFRSMFKKEFEELEEEKRQKEEEKRRKQEEAKRAETEFVESCKSFLTPVCGFDKKTTKKNILAFLKYSFKGVKFTARKDYNTYEISWTDGPTPLEVRAICAHFIDTYFDIYTDYEDYKPTLFTKTFGGISCNVQTNRTYSKEVIKETLQEAKKIYPEIDITTNMLGQTLTMDRNRPNKFYNNHCGLGGIVCLKDLVYNYLKNVSFYENPEETATATAVAGTTGNDETTTATAETATTGSDHKEETTTATTGNDETKGLTLIEYSAKAVAVIGDTFPIKEQLKKLGGRFNARLTCGAGWVFSKKREQELRQALNIA